MSNSENPATSLKEDLSDPLQFMVKYEVEKYRPITEDDMMIAGFSGTGAVIGGLAADGALYDNKSLVIAPLNKAEHIAHSAANHVEAAIGTLTGMAGPSAGPAKQTITVSSATTPSAENVSFVQQAETFAGIVTLVTFALVAVRSAARYRFTRRQQNFKSSMSYEELEEMWYDEDNDTPSV